MNHSNQPGNLGQQQRRPVRKPPIMLLLLLGVMAIFLYSQYRKISGQPTPGPVVIPDISNDRPNFHPTPNPDDNRSDWSIDTDLPSTVLENQTEVVIGKGRGSAATQAGDWSLEVGESKQSGGGPNLKSGPKSTRKGDWEVSEVETKD